MPRNDETTDTATDVSPSATRDSPDCADTAHGETLPSPAPGRASALGSGTKVGRYEILGVIGSGGMGVVYRARDTELARDVAIKVVSFGDSRDRDQVLAEARAMAKLDHPSLIPVYDVGTIAAGVYVVMPLLTGGTLDDWMRAQRRTWSQVLDRFVRAGRGLVAAHAAGIVHRDFKPKNVLLEGDDVLVADFGVAMANEPPGVSANRSPSITLVGSAAYMAPEQARGDAIDARADQFSFCVSLWEGLHGQRPQLAATRALATNRSIPPVPVSRRGAPTWLLAAIARGLSSEPALRWPSMSALLDHLGRPMRRPRRVALWLIAVAAIGAVAIAVAARMTRRGAAQECPDARVPLARVWNPTVRSGIESAISGTKLSYAKDVAGLLIPEIDQRADAWRIARAETCHAGQARRVAGMVLDQRIRCLDRWLVELEGTAKLLGAVSDPKSLDTAVDAARAMSPVAGCTDDAALGKRRPPPPEKRVEANAIEDEILRLELARRGRRSGELGSRLNEVVERARKLGHAPTLARALRAQAIVHHDVEKYVDEKQVLEELAQVAAAGGDDWTSAWAWTELVLADGMQQLPEEALSMIPPATAAIARAGNPVELRARLLQNEAMIIDQRGEAERALTLLAQARTLLIEAGADRPGSAHTNLLQTVLVGLGAAQGAKGDFDDSIATFRSALETGAILRGAEHPSMAKLHANLAQSLRRTGRLEEALSALETARQITETGIGEGPQLVRVYAPISAIYFDLGKYEESVRSYERTLAMAIRVMPLDDPYVFKIISDRATALRAVGQVEEAVLEMDRVVAFHEERDGTSMELASTLANRAGGNRDLRRFAPAIADFTRAIALMETPKKGNRRGMVNALVGLGLTYILAGRPAEAIAPLEAADKDATPGRREDLQRVGRWLLGRARVESSREIAKGIAEVKAARSALAAAGETEELVELDAWLAKHTRN